MVITGAELKRLEDRGVTGGDSMKALELLTPTVFSTTLESLN
jgi:hypothetical protein